jgi:dTDP-4-dehydrorhamnose reductase
MSRIVITGAAGLLGQNLIALLTANHQLLCIDIAADTFELFDNINYLKADLTQFETIRPRLIEFDADMIFNCAALSDVDACETEKKLADKLNFELVNRLLGTPFKKFIHYSSDYVFDGETGPYAEDDPVNPINYYGATKMHSERILQNSGVNYLIIRTNVLYGHARNVRMNFIDWVYQSLKNGDSIKIVDDQYNNPTLASNLAEASIEAALADTTGILHIAGADYLSRYEIAVKVARHFGFPVDLIKKTTTVAINQKAKRPNRAGLKIDKARSLLKTKLLGLDDGFKAIV